MVFLCVTIGMTRQVSSLLRVAVGAVRHTTASRAVKLGVACLALGEPKPRQTEAIAKATEERYY